jgi:hypothetical protein
MWQLIRVITICRVISTRRSNRSTSLNCHLIARITSQFFASPIAILFPVLIGFNVTPKFVGEPFPPPTSIAVAWSSTDALAVVPLSRED